MTEEKVMVFLPLWSLVECCPQILFVRSSAELGERAELPGVGGAQKARSQK